MSTLKSSAEHLTLNADGSGNDIKFQSNATEVAAIDQSGNLTLSGTVDGVDIAARDAILTSTTTTAGAALPKAGGTMTGALIVDKTNNGYSGARFHDDSGGDYNSYIDLGRDQSGTRLTIRRGGRVQNQTPWNNATPTPIVSFANGGIAFGTDTAAANTLDDYEEGTFTPAWATTSGAQPTVGYSSRFGHYVKVGRLVTLRFEMYMNALTVNGATSSVLILNNLPFALANPAASVGSNTTAYFYWARARSELTGYGFNEIGLLGTVDRTGNAQAWNWETISALRSNSEFRATIQYETNS
jgi:hypothetical protein